MKVLEHVVECLNISDVKLYKPMVMVPSAHA